MSQQTQVFAFSQGFLRFIANLRPFRRFRRLGYPLLVRLRRGVERPRLTKEPVRIKRRQQLRIFEVFPAWLLCCDRLEQQLLALPSSTHMRTFSARASLRPTAAFAAFAHLRISI